MDRVQSREGSKYVLVECVLDDTGHLGTYVRSNITDERQIKNVLGLGIDLVESESATKMHVPEASVEAAFQAVKTIHEAERKRGGQR